MMKRLRPSIAPFAVLALLTVGVSQAAENRWLPEGFVPVARAAAEPVAPEMVGKNPPLSESPAETNLAADGGTGDNKARVSDADQYLRRSESHFNAGRQLYFEGDFANARREFDQAVDALLKAPETLQDHARLERRLDEICNLIYRFDVEKLGAGRTNDDKAVAFDKAPIDAINDMTFGVDEKLAPKLQSEITQVLSGIPLELAGPVPGLIHYFSATENGRRTLQAGYQRAGRYRALIARILAEEGVPQELIYLAQAESGFLPRAVSNKKAVGMWQFIAETGNRYKLYQSGFYDERLDPEKATRAAARFLKFLHQRYGDWYLAMAAYNCGAGAVDRAVERTGYADYWELLRRHTLPRETANYVPIIVALTIIGKNPHEYGLDNLVAEAPLEYDSIHLSASTHLDLVADATLQPVSVIRDLNPSLLGRSAPAGFQVHVPKGMAQTTQAALESVPAGNRQTWRLHHVSNGDTLATIAKSYHLAPERIASVNGSFDAFEAGDTVMIPAPAPAVLKQRLVKGRHGKSHYALARIRSTRSTVTQRGTRVAASRRVPARALHRRVRR